MIKDFRKITEKDLDYLLTHQFTVWEKLDMFYFRVEITKIGAIALKGSTGKVISDIDCVTNSLYKDVCEFVNTHVNPVRNKIIEEYGEGCIGFFYLPDKVYHKVGYPHLHAQTGILSDWSYNIDITTREAMRIKYLAGLLNVCEPPLLKIWNVSAERMITYYNNEQEIKDLVHEYANTGSSSIRFKIIEMLLDAVNTSCSGNYIENIEGIIIRTDKFQYQIKVQDTEDYIDKSTKLIYRDTLLNSIAEYYDVNRKYFQDTFDKEDSYIDRVSKLFLSYIEDTDLFAKFSFDPEDLLPPTNAYFGDIDFDMIPDNNVKLICKYNEVNKNIFRLFLHTFSQKISEDKFSSLSESTKSKLNDLIIHLKYKNYKEILLTAYKAKN